MARKCFYSFHFKPDCRRAGTVRSIGTIEGNAPVSDNDWEAIASGADKDAKIEPWIADQMVGRTCTIVLVGSETANRKWINHEIVRSWDARMSVVGIRIHGLRKRIRASRLRRAPILSTTSHMAPRILNLPASYSATIQAARRVRSGMTGSASIWRMPLKRRSQFGENTLRR